ncbi:hypothetical protein MCUN1_000223 [Malassezia cuniculi]|uniref:Maf1 regulator n=1 Tax=Malassezia cuniculi TaxID=948313 RepID=A0AAF0EQU6_9BASI|nr:hypothetical protein MCUN1_000223 [Malassezia cuniculi]
MKYIEYPELELLSRALTFEMAECRVFTRLEAYSCKAVNKEKRLFKSLESSYLLSASTSPPAYLDEALASPFGRLDQPAARKTLFLLIATLNGAFPDHDFSDVNPTDFTREPSASIVMESITQTLLGLKHGAGSPHSHASLDASLDDLGAIRSPGRADASRPASLASALDEIIQISDCEAYTFHPDMDSDPHASAEPDEEGAMADDPYDEHDDEHDGVVSRGGTPQEDMDEDERDEPLFDEEVFGTGLIPFLGVPGRTAAQTPKTAAYVRPASAHHSSSIAGSSNSVDLPGLSVDEDDLGGAGAGLLWSTFAFFYNRRLKRILFVSVWSRRNTAGPAPWTSPSLMATSATPDVPSFSLAPQPPPGAHAVTPDASPARSRARRARESLNPYARPGRSGRRETTGSPAPSALSPFPHVAGRAAPDVHVFANDATHHITPSGFLSLDAALHSSSAPEYIPSYALGKSSRRFG